MIYGKGKTDMFHLWALHAGNFWMWEEKRGESGGQIGHVGESVLYKRWNGADQRLVVYRESGLF